MSLKSIILFVAGLGFLMAAASSAWRTSHFIAASEVVAGSVSSLNAGGSHPQIEFATRAGEAISYPQGGLIGGYKTGDHVKVRYDPANAKGTASLDTFGALWMVPLVLTFFAGCFFIGAAASRTTNTVQAGRYG